MTPLLAAASSSPMEEGTSAQAREVARQRISGQVEEVPQVGNDTTQAVPDEEQVVARGISSQLAHGVAKAQGNLLETWKVCSLSSSQVHMILFRF